MLPELKISSQINHKRTNIFLIKEISEIPEGFFNGEELEYITRRLSEKGKQKVTINKLGQISVVSKINQTEDTNPNTLLEKNRKAGESLLNTVNEHKIETVNVFNFGHDREMVLSFVEGMVLGNYQFLKYRKDRDEKESSLKVIEVICSDVNENDLKELYNLCKAVYVCRSLVNEPLSALNAEKLATEFESIAHEAGIKVEVLNKQKIEALKMGGLLAVNLGSIDPPTFTIMEYYPMNAINAKPIVLVGKGVVYDTGGLSLKPNSSMDTMKSDMAGAATVVSALFAIAFNKLPVYVVALVPATDNRPDGNAYVPGDVITMMDGTTVEVLNTDAEGRLILADALTYAKKYDPLLVIDIATLTGSAEAALGRLGMAGMQNNAEAYFSQMVESGFSVFERIAEFPFWDDYEELLKSEIADLKNIGGRFGGVITAGKFLQHFTDYPWIHLDIAGPAFSDKRDSYRNTGGTGVGVRLFFEFIKRLAALKIKE